MPPPTTVDGFVDGILAGDRTVLARAVTLVESTRRDHRAMADEVLQRVLPRTGGARRIGITGVPGVGKSTFIEALGTWLLDRGHRVAVLTVDPSSRRTGGSILGDKTRMGRLSVADDAFVRPSPSAGTLGGVTRRTRETMLVCEAAGYDVVLVETVGVGQSEVTVRDMVDVFLVLALPNAGDTLQGIKKGVIELADVIAVNKADGETRRAAERARNELRQALHMLAPSSRARGAEDASRARGAEDASRARGAEDTSRARGAEDAPAWRPEVTMMSALEGEGIAELWEVLERHREALTAAGELETLRRDQLVTWMWSEVEDRLLTRLRAHRGVRDVLPDLERAVAAAELTSGLAADQVLETFARPRPEDGTGPASGEADATR